MRAAPRFQNVRLEFFLNIETGETVLINEIDPDSEDESLDEIIEEGFNQVYFRVPHSASYEGFGDMNDFAETVADERLRNALFIALNQNKKVFRKFKATLASDNDELDRYYRFVEARNRERIIEWLLSIGITPVIE